MYFAPEVLRRKLHPRSVNGMTYSCSSDMWSVGVIMFNLLCARNPWTAAEFEKTLEDSPFDIDKKKPWPKISASAKDLLRKLWNPDSNTRIEAKDALRHPWLKGTKEIILGESGGVPLSLGGCPVRPKHRSKKRKRDDDGGGSKNKSLRV
jgi:serine/threonine protein kinase